MTPSRAVLLFKNKEGKGHEHSREALPWWFFGVAGGLLASWLGPQFLLVLAGWCRQSGLAPLTNWLAPQLALVADWKLQAGEGLSSFVSLPAAVFFVCGMLPGGLLGWVVIKRVNAVLGWSFRGFNRGFDAMSTGYSWCVGGLLRGSLAVLLVYVGLLALTYTEFQRAPTGFIPQQDQGRLIVNIQLPDSSALQRTDAAVQRIVRIAHETPGVAHTVAFSGFSFLLQANSPNFASMFIVLDSFDKRQRPELRDTAIMDKLSKAWSAQVKEAMVTVLPSSPIPGLGTAGGFKFIVEDKGDLGVVALQEQTDKVIRTLATAGYQIADSSLATLRSENVPVELLDKLKDLKGKRFETEESFLKELANHLDKAELARIQRSLLKNTGLPSGLNRVTTQFRSKTPQLFVDILGVSLNDVNQTLDMYMGSLYVNSFNDFGRHWQVTIQAEGDYRNQIDDLNLLQVRNQFGQMVLLGTLVSPKERPGPIAITRYNLYTAASVSGNIKTGYSTGDAIKTIEKKADETLPLSMKSDWTELMFMQKRAGNTSIYVFFLAIVCVFLALSALYESWSLPLAVILVVPLCLLCSVEGVLLTNRDVNIFVQIGLVVLVGLACKNAILVVEYAKQLHQEGKSCFAATKEASRLRLRPILMTSLAFVFGVIPLTIASGAGAEMRRSLGTAVFSGMLGVTLFGIFLTPVFFYVIIGLGESRLFASASVRWFVSCSLGALAGLAGGYLLGKLGVVRLPWAALVGAGAGVLIVLGVLEIHRRIKPQLTAPGLKQSSGSVPFESNGGGRK
jgi:multidrug efflux pump